MSDSIAVAASSETLRNRRESLDELLERQRQASLDRFTRAFERNDLAPMFGQLLGLAQSVKIGDGVNEFAVERLDELGKLYRALDDARRSS